MGIVLKLEGVLGFFTFLSFLDFEMTISFFQN